MELCSLRLRLGHLRVEDFWADNDKVSSALPGMLKSYIRIVREFWGPELESPTPVNLTCTLVALHHDTLQPGQHSLRQMLPDTFCFSEHTGHDLRDISEDLCGEAQRAPSR